MTFVIFVLGILQIVGGLLAYAGAASAIHQILGAVSFGLGILCLALGVVIMRLTEIRDSLQPAVPPAEPIEGPAPIQRGDSIPKALRHR